MTARLNSWTCPMCDSLNASEGVNCLCCGAPIIMADEPQSETASSAACNFLVTASHVNSEIIGAAHSLYYWLEKDSFPRRHEIERLNKAMASLVSAFKSFQDSLRCEDCAERDLPKGPECPCVQETAAASDLLEALKAVRNYHNGGREYSVEMIDAALAKAEGK